MQIERNQLTIENFPVTPERATIEGKNKFLGFWVFLGGESILFASLFATYLALNEHTAGGPTAEELFKLPLVFTATMLLLTSSLTCVYAMYHMKNFHFAKMQFWLGVTILLGACFLGLEIFEFNEYVKEGHKFTSSAFGSAFYTLVGTHGAHVTFGLLWMITLMIRNAKRGLSLYNAPKFFLVGLYWHLMGLVG